MADVSHEARADDGAPITPEPAPMLLADAADAGQSGRNPLADDPVEDDGRSTHKPLGITFWLAVAWIGVVAIAGLFSGFLPTDDPNAIDIPSKLLGPFSDGHILGTDGLGRDILARLIDGARVSLTVSLTAVAVGMLVGGLLGTLAGFVRGFFDVFFVAGINIMLAFPGIVLLLALVSVLEQNLVNISLVIGVLSIPIYARVARANSLAVSERDYVLAARALGATQKRILFREILPVVLMPLLAFALTALGVVIVAEGTLAFLGLSVEPPAATWGSMIAEGRRHDETHLHPVIIPSLALFLTVLSFNFVGEALRARFADLDAKV
ncbi:ABC transporter permease [Acidimicrobiia bacterium EGI L10123]|uniref:ABC transporter permease n=1 Tax=Salinilacustrithrix flava TaxID=2957203 RepID=UPI003D7C2F04|nr:ABC transporter permease [Acidimicrobiia bacterium EGI L10123]